MAESTNPTSTNGWLSSPVLKKLWSLAAIGKPRLIAILLLVALMALRVWDPGPLETVRLKTFDFYQQLKPRPIPADSKVVIVDLDEKSLKEVGQWPWPRTTIAKLVRNTMQMGAAVIAFDIVFAEPDRLNLANIAETAVGLDKETREKLRKPRSNDAVLASIIKRSRATTI